MSDKNTYQGLTFTSALLLIFITLKLTNVIDWSWWWVLSPIWVTLSLFLMIISAALIYISFYKKGKRS